GVTGVFFRALAVTVGMALLTSLALALTWTPTLSHFFIRQRRVGPDSAGRSAHGEVRATRLMRIYERTLRFSLEHRLDMALFAIVLIGGSYFAYNHTGSDLLP